MPGTPIQTLIVNDMVTRLKAMDGVGKAAAQPEDAYTYRFDRVETVKENEITVGDDVLAVVYSGDVTYEIAGLQAAITKLARVMPFVVLFVFNATPSDPTDPRSTDRDAEADLMFADLHKCLAAMQHAVIGNTSIEIEFGADMKNQTVLEHPRVYGELHGRLRFRHNMGNAAAHT